MANRLNGSRTPAGRRIIAVTVAAALLLAALVTGRSIHREGAAASDEDAQPSDCVTAMIAAEQAGDAKAYLHCFTGRLRNRLESHLKVDFRRPGAAGLPGRTAGLSGYAMTDLEFAGPDAATLVLERIYGESGERQRLRLRRVQGAWKIVEWSSPERFALELPHGMPDFVPPEEND